MSIEKLKRVLWRIREWKMADDFHDKMLRRAIMLECGTFHSTISANRARLMELGMIKRIQCKHFKIVDENPQ